MTAVVVRDLTVCDSAGTVVLDRGRLTVDAGRVVALVGPSGSGKTTLLRAVAGALPAGLRRLAGTVRVLGHDVHELAAEPMRELRRSRISYVGQDPGSGLNPRMRVRMLLGELARDRRPDTAHRLLAAVRLPATDDVLRRRPGQLSGGQQRRVALARGLSRRPELLLLDEPTAGMDAALRAEIVELLRELAVRDGVAVVLACHDPGVVDAVADSVVDLGARPAASRPTSLLRRDPPDPDRPPLLDVRALSARIGRCTIVTDVSFALPAGGVLALTGDSGSGKTTLARAIAGLHPAARGELTLAGDRLALQVARRSCAQRRLIQLVPQDPRGTLNPGRTVFDAVARPLLLHRLRAHADVAARVAELLTQVELDPGLGARHPHELSGGQRQRVAVARALAAEPAVLICDEITAALDADTAESIMSLLDRRRAGGLGVVLISHDQELVARHADAAFALETGSSAVARNDTSPLG